MTSPGPQPAAASSPLGRAMSLPPPPPLPHAGDDDDDQVPAKPGATVAAPSDPPYSFATHLLGSFAAAKRRSQHTVRAVGSLAALVKARADIEAAYAKQLEKAVAAHTATMAAGSSGGGSGLVLRTPKSPFNWGNAGGGSRGEADDEAASTDPVESTFSEAVEHVRADMLNKAVQRRTLSQHLAQEIYEPMDLVYSNLALESDELEQEAGALAKELRGLEGKYRQAHKKHEQASQQAAALCQQITDQGGMPPTLDAQAVLAKHTAQAAAAAAVIMGGPVATPTTGPAAPMPSSHGRSVSKGELLLASPFLGRGEDLLLAGSPAARRIASLSSNLLTKVSQADPTSWLLPPADKDRGGDLAASATEQLEQAELLRLACRDRHGELRQAARRAAHKLQLLLSRYQLLEETCLDELQTLLRKAVVFESSCLANEQYEAQLIFKAVEAIDKDRDLEAFIAAHRASSTNTSTAAEDDDDGDLTATVLRSLGVVTSAQAPLPPLPAATSGDEEEETGAGGATSPSSHVLQPADLPNLSSPAPHVVPAATVLRLLKGGPAGAASRSAPASIVNDGMAKAALAASPAPPLQTPPRSPPPAVVLAAAQKADKFEEEDDDDDDDDEEEESDDESEESEEEEDGFGDERHPRSLKELVQQKKQQQQQAKPNKPKPIVEVEEFRTEGGGVEYGL